MSIIAVAVPKAKKAKTPAVAAPTPVSAVAGMGMQPRWNGDTKVLRGGPDGAAKVLLPGPYVIVRKRDGKEVSAACKLEVEAWDDLWCKGWSRECFIGEGQNRTRVEWAKREEHFVAKRVAERPAQAA